MTEIELLQIFEAAMIHGDFGPVRAAYHADVVMHGSISGDNPNLDDSIYVAEVIRDAIQIQRVECVASVGDDRSRYNAMILHGVFLELDQPVSLPFSVFVRFDADGVYEAIHNIDAIRLLTAMRTLPGNVLELCLAGVRFHPIIAPLREAGGPMTYEPDTTIAARRA